MKKKKTKVSDIQSVIMLALSLMTVTTSIFIGLLVYNRYETAMRHNDVSNTQNMMESIVSSTEQYLKSMRQLANTINYNIIQMFPIRSSTSSSILFMKRTRIRYRVLHFMIWKES